MRLLQHLSVLVGLATLANASPANKGKCNGKDCQKVLKALYSIKASPFCSDFLNIRTVTSTVTSTAKRQKTVAATETTTVQVSVTATTTKIVTVVDKDSVTNTVHVTPTPVTNVVTVPAEKDVTYTQTSTSTSTFCGLSTAADKRGALPTSPSLQSRVNIPKVLQYFNRQQLTDACNCYLTSKTPKVITITRTVTATQTKTTIKTVTTKKTFVAATVVVTSTINEPTTVTFEATTTLDPATVISTHTSTKTVTVTTTVPTTVSISKDYTLKYSQRGCPYNAGPAIRMRSTNSADAKQECACTCNRQTNCVSWVLHEYITPSQFWCKPQTSYFNPAYLKCDDNNLIGVAYDQVTSSTR